MRQVPEAYSPARTLWLTLAGIGALTAASLAVADELKPFQATYEWVWHGMTVAVSSLQLEKSGDTWTYTSKSEPRGIGRMFSERPRQVSVLRVTSTGVQPLSYKADDGTSSTKRAVDLTYDWTQRRVSGIYEDTRVNLPLTPEVRDDASVQVAMMVELLSGRTPDKFGLLNKDQVREYRYKREGEATLKTPFGDVATVIYSSQAAYSPRMTRFWCAPDHGYIPIRVEQTRGDDVQWTMQIQSLRRD